MTVNFTYMEAEVTIQGLEIICNDQLVKDLVSELLMGQPRAAHLPDPEIVTAETLKEWGLIDGYKVIDLQEEDEQIIN